MSGGCKDLTRPTSIIYIFKITESARRLFFLETVLKQDTLLLHNPKERRGEKVCPFFLLENSRPLSPWGPLDFLSTCLGNDSLRRVDGNVFYPPGKFLKTSGKCWKTLDRASFVC